ncbi:MAG: glycosyltransferase [Gammaproteobacteria bacterium]|nr:glycosyltransferase [Gammaproteobacteria bacterium]
MLISLADLSASIGEAVTSIRLARTFAELGHEVTLLAPAPAGSRPVVAARPARVRHSLNVARWGLPNSLNTLVQLWIVLRMVLAGEVDVIYVRSASLTFLYGLLFRGWTRVLVVSEHHGWLAAERRISGRYAWLAPLERWLQLLDARFASRVRTVVPGIRQHLTAGGVNAERVVVIGNAADTEAIRPLPRNPALAKFGLDPDGVYLGFLGSLTPWQGLDDVLPAVAQLAARDPRIRLLLCGEGPCRATLTAQAQALGIADRVVWLGRVAHDQVARVLACFDLALLPTHVGAYAEIGRSPLKLREYAAAGRAVLAAEIDAIDSLVGQPWIEFYRPGDLEGFCATATRLLTDRAALERAGRAARDYAESHYAWPVIARSILAGLPLPARVGP